MRAHVLVADPPWLFGDKLPGAGRGAVKHYRCLTQTDLLAFPLPELEARSVLFLWRVASMQQEALDVAEAWGFTVKSELVWRKLTRTGKRHFGMGRYVRMEHETCLIATRGGLSVPPLVRNIRSTFEAPVGRHSEKPDAFYTLVEQLFPGPYVELFARRRRDGWDCRGDELEAREAA